jgi:small-conductance mechanosensitive channel
MNRPCLTMNDDDLNFLLSDVFSDLKDPLVLWQAGAIIACLLVSLFVARWLRARIRQRTDQFATSAADRGDALTAEHLRTGSAGVRAVLFPTLSWLLLLLAGRILKAIHQQTHLLHIAAVVMFSGALIRLAFYAIRRIFKPSGLLAALERIFQLVVWSVVALHLAGLLPDVLQSLEEMSFTFGKTEISVWQILTASFWVIVTLIAALWAGASLEDRLMNTPTLDSSLQLVFSRVGRAVLILIALLVSLNVVGIPLGVLSVFGGALGVGLGLGLQRIASNYASGFIILLDRSLRLGDLITVDKYHGTVAQIRTRYTVLRALDASEAIIPNELLVSQPVLNQSYSDRRIGVTQKIQISYDSDVQRAMQLMIAAAAAQERVLKEPAPSVNLINFGADGLDLDLNYNISDPEKGTGTLRSAINLLILASFQEAGISFPFPQRDVRVQLHADRETTETAKFLKNSAENNNIKV